MAEIRTVEHFLFREYSKSLKKWLQDNVYLARYPRDNNVTIVYGTPERAWAQYIYPIINSGTLSPNINFHLENMEYIEGENLLGSTKEFREVDGKILEVPPPLIYRLTYSATFFTRVQSELDILFYQILSKAHKNKKAAFMVDGQWAELTASEPQNETNLEPPGVEDILRRGRLTFTISRAYLPLEAKEVGKITSTEMNYVINNI